MKDASLVVKIARIRSHGPCNLYQKNKRYKNGVKSHSNRCIMNRAEVVVRLKESRGDNRLVLW